MLFQPTISIVGKQNKQIFNGLTVFKYQFKAIKPLKRFNYLLFRKSRD